MKEQPKQPERHSDLRDPKLPAINGGPCGNRAEGRIWNSQCTMRNSQCAMTDET